MSLLASLVAVALTPSVSPAQAGTVEVPFRLGESAIIVDAKVNGKDLSFMFDTGYGGTVIVDSSIYLGQPSGTITLRDFVGELQANLCGSSFFVQDGRYPRYPAGKIPRWKIRETNRCLLPDAHV